MSVPLSFTILVDYVDGEKEKFEVEVEAGDIPVTSRVDQTIKAGVVALETPESLVAIPTSSIKRLTIAPAPATLPSYVVRNVRRVE